MASAAQFFIGSNDSNDVITSKLVRAQRAELAQDGKTSISTTSATVPDLGIEAWGVVKATADTAVASLTSINPATLQSETLTPTLKQGEAVHGYFTAITLTSGAVECRNIKGKESAPVPGFSLISVTPNVTDDKKLDYNFTIARIAGGFPPPSTEIWRKVDSGSYALLTTVSDVNGHFTYNDLQAQTGGGSVIKYKARYKNAGLQLGAYSAEITPATDLPVVTLGTGTWVHSSLTGGMTVTIPTGSTKAPVRTDFIEIWGFANAAAVVANGALTLLATVNPAVDGATTYVYTKVYTGLDDSSSKTLKFQARWKTADSTPVYGLRTAVLSVTASAS